MESARWLIEHLLQAECSAKPTKLGRRTRGAKEGGGRVRQVTGRDKVVQSLNAAHKQFLAYRKAQCRYVLDATDAGTGADDAQRDCMVRLARQRIAELKNSP